MIDRSVVSPMLAMRRSESRRTATCSGVCSRSVAHRATTDSASSLGEEQKRCAANRLARAADHCLYACGKESAQVPMK
jgi:hypothetical protein